MDKDSKVEASIPVQSRVDIRVLAELDIYWSSEGYFIKTMSQLINWSLDLCSQVLKVNNALPQTIESMEEANQHLVHRGLYQKGILKRGRLKLIRGQQLESIKLAGGIPRVKGSEGNREYRRAHNDHSIIGAPEIEKPGLLEELGYSEEDIAEAERLEKEERDREYIERKAKMEIDENGVVVVPVDRSNDYTEEDRKRDEAKKAQALVNQLEPHKKPTDSDQIRKKTNDEIQEDIDRIAKKDKEQEEAWNKVDMDTVRSNIKQTEKGK